MADGSAIEWTDATWNPVTGCSVISPGCTNCYAMRLAGGRLKNHHSRRGLTRDSKAGPVWTGEVRLNEGFLDLPLRWTRPRMIFVCAHGDLFHESVPDAWIDRVFAIMALAPRHTFQVLTKRAERMRGYMANVEREALWMDAVAAALAASPSLAAQHHAILGRREPWLPLPNVWLGVSAENQKHADERLPHLLSTPAAKRFLSAEPLLGPTTLSPKDKIVGMLSRWYGPNGFDPEASQPFNDRATWLFPKIDWVIAGGESGPAARPMHPDWVRHLRDQCTAAKVPFFFKQWGEFHPSHQHDDRETGCEATPLALRVDGTTVHAPAEAFALIGSKEPGWVGMCRLGKKIAGRLLDGREHNDMPEVIRG